MVNSGPSAAPGVVIAAPASGSGKTLITLGLLRAFRRSGVAVRGLKTGPDYIDPAFHRAASGAPCLNIDPWGMKGESIDWLLQHAGDRADLLIAEGVMGLFDGAADGRGSTADLAAIAGWPVILILDVSGQSGSAAAIVCGFQSHRPDIRIGGVVLNRCGSTRHESMIRSAIRTLPDPPTVLGALPKDTNLSVPSRHLGLVQASENRDLDALIERAANWIETHVDLDQIRLLSNATDTEAPAAGGQALIDPLGQHTAIAKDTAFAFCYDGLLDAWHSRGATLSFFSPLADEDPHPEADAVYLPGGYPELHAGKLAASKIFLSGLRQAAEQQKAVFGECGGYMVLGESLIDGDGTPHRMAGLLPLETSFENPKRHLGYRRAETRVSSVLGPKGTAFRAHEFHYSVTIREAIQEKLFSIADAANNDLGVSGMVSGTVAGSFLHLIDREG